MTSALLHVGFAKAGSTFLQEWFQRHPELCFTPHALGGFRDVFQLADFAHEQPGRHFRYFVTSNEMLGAGGRVPYGCPLYSFRMLRDADMRRGQRDICRTLHAMLPDASVIIVTRGFSSIIRSLYSQYVKLGGRRDFLEFLDEYNSILVQWLDVDYHLALYRETFGTDHTLVLPYEMLKADQATFLALIEQHLGLEHFDDIPGAENPSLGRDRLYWYARLSRWWVTPLAELFGPGPAGRIYYLYGFKVVQPDRLGPVISLINRLLPRTADLSYPDGYLDRFRGSATSLANSRWHQPFLSEYLVDTPPQGD